MGQPIGDPLTADALARRAEQIKEYETYVAATDIYVGVALAYNQGDPVPASNVARHMYDHAGLVVKRDSAAGRKALEARGFGVASDTDAAIVAAHRIDVAGQAVTDKEIEAAPAPDLKQPEESTTKKTAGTKGA